jgi:hypothetical protein
MEEQQTPPTPIKIQGMEKDLGAILDSFVGNWRIKTRNREVYRQKWEEFLPTEYFDKSKNQNEIIHKPWSMAYIPRISIRKAFAGNIGKFRAGMEKNGNWPYFVLVLNSSRDTRPQTPVPEGQDLLQRNILDRNMIISEVGRFYLTPNGFPYHQYASLLISQEKRPQGKVTPGDITDWIKFSFLTDQYVFFNSVGAGASRPERFHAQVVDPEVMHYEGRTITYPIRNENVVRKNKVKDGIYELKEYPMEALIFSGKDAPHQASRLISNLEGYGLAYNVMVCNSEVYVLARNSKRQRSDCIGKNIGGYESTGVILVGNVEEPILGALGLEKMIHANEIFNELSYETICNNLSAASMPTRWMKDSL